MTRDEFRVRAEELLAEDWFAGVPTPANLAAALMPLYDETVDGKIEGYAKAALQRAADESAKRPSKPMLGQPRGTFEVIPDGMEDGKD